MPRISCPILTPQFLASSAHYQSMVKQQVDHLPGIVDASSLDELVGGTEQDGSVDFIGRESSLKGIEEFSIGPSLLRRC